MDEPAASLDFGNQAQVLAEIAPLARGDGGHGVILSTHDPDQALALGARVALMKQGAILAEGVAETVLTGDQLSTVYGDPVRVETTQSGRRICLPSLVRQSVPASTPEALITA